MSSHTCVPNMFQNVSAIKRDETCLELSEKCSTKSVLDRKKKQQRRVVDPGVFNNTIILIELTGYIFMTLISSASS